MQFKLLCGMITMGMVHAVCTQPRIRKSWDDMTSIEKTTYISAVELSMDKGFHMLFAEIHKETVSSQHAHETCGFLLWHRRFLLAYENMLRSMGSAYECVTIPYWNYYGDYAKRISNTCSTMQGCSNIMPGLGGSSGSTKTLNIAGSSISGRCSIGRPNNHFCQSSQTNGSACAKCLPRGNWGNTNLPSGLGYSSLANMILSGTSYTTIGSNIQNGNHNSIHSACGSTMSSFTSPADIIFFSHHSTVDMLHHLYYECQVGRAMTEDEKKTSTLAFGTCTNAIATLTATSDILMRWKLGTSTAVTADQYSKLIAFFDGVGTQYYQFVDNLDMGLHSYGYQIGPLVTNLVKNGLICPAGDPSTRNNRQLRMLKRQHGLDTYSKIDDEKDASLKKAKLSYIHWFNDILEKAKNVTTSIQGALEQVELIECLYHDVKLGGVEDYTAEFKQNFNVKGSSLCVNVLAAVKQGRKKVLVEKWESIYTKHFA